MFYANSAWFCFWCLWWEKIRVRVKVSDEIIIASSSTFLKWYAVICSTALILWLGVWLRARLTPTSWRDQLLQLLQILRCECMCSVLNFCVGLLFHSELDSVFFFFFLLTHLRHIELHHHEKCAHSLGYYLKERNCTCAYSLNDLHRSITNRHISLLWCPLSLF